MSNVKIAHRNYLQASLLNLYQASSENAQAPLRNIFLDRRRAQVWRSQGYFVVTAANKGIVFEETASTPLTANIAEGVYTSSTTFLAAVKTALDAAGASTYTVARDVTTQKIQITSDLLGGGNTFNLLWANAGSTAAGTLGYDNSTNDTGSSSYLADEAIIHTEEWIEFDLGAVSNPKAFIITGQRNGFLGISQSATVKLQANNSNTWTAPPVDLTLEWDDRSISAFSDSGLGGYRYWRLHIVDQDNASGFVEIAKIFLGDVIELERGTIQFPLRTTMVDFATPSESMMGVNFSNKRQKTMDLNFSWFGVSNADAEALRDFWEDVGTSTPFFVSLDPKQAFSTNNKRWICLLQFKSDPSMDLEKPRLWAGTWDLREVL